MPRAAISFQCYGTRTVIWLTARRRSSIVGFATVVAHTAQRCPHDTSSGVGRHSCLLAGLVSGAGDCRKKPIQRTARGFQMRFPTPLLRPACSPAALLVETMLHAGRRALTGEPLILRSRNLDRAVAAVWATASPHGCCRTQGVACPADHPRDIPGIKRARAAWRGLCMAWGGDR